MHSLGCGRGWRLMLSRVEFLGEGKASECGKDASCLKNLTFVNGYVQEAPHGHPAFLARRSFCSATSRS